MASWLISPLSAVSFPEKRYYFIFRCRQSKIIKMFLFRVTFLGLLWCAERVAGLLVILLIVTAWEIYYLRNEVALFW